MKKIQQYVALLAAVCALLHTAYAQSSFAVVKTSGNTVITSTLAAAVTAASNGDIIYLPTGTVDATGLKINKGVHLIGAGYNPDSSGVQAQTIIGGNIVFVSGADGGSLQGVFVNGSINFGSSQSDCEVHNFVVTRCYVGGAMYLADAWNAETKGSNFTITENIINYGICGGKASNTLLANNIIVQLTVQFRPLTFFKNATIANNIIISMDNYVSNDVLNTTFRNNIIPVGNLGYVNGYTGNIYLNNLHCSSAGLNAYGVTQSSGNVYIDRDKLFVKQSGGTFAFSDNYHLSATALSAITGTDGSQVGVYGGAYVFKDGALPPTPALLQSKVATKSNAKGKLDVEFKVQAQSK